MAVAEAQQGSVRRLAPSFAIVERMANSFDARIDRVRRLFVDRFPGERTGEDVLAFYGWLCGHDRGLLPRANGDPYQNLKSDLKGLWLDRTP